MTYEDMYRVLKNNSVAVIFASWKNFSNDYNHLCKIFSIKNVIIWWKPGGGMGDIKHSLSTDFEMALVCHKGKCEIRGKRIGSVWKFKKVNSNKAKHPTQKPHRLLEQIMIKYSDCNNTVLDPFMGSGSTGVACMNTVRDFIGIELDPKYYELSKNNIIDSETLFNHVNVEEVLQ